MTQRTCNIIMCCKGNDKYSYRYNPIESIKRYMGEACMFPWRDYTPAMVEDILYTALMDYIDGVPKPSQVLFDLRDYGRRSSTLSEKIVTMFGLVQVRDDDGYVNGFSEELIRQSERDLNA